MFIADNVDMTLSYGVSMPLLRDIKSQVSEAICTTTTDNGARNLIINPAKPPFDNAELRRAVSLALDRKAFVDILVEGQGLIGGVMQPPPDGIWGLPADKLAELPGYDPEVAKNRAEARAIMEKLGYGPNKRPRGHRLDPQHRGLPRSGRHRDRPDEGDLHRRHP
jgi:peptide/nickel transport system substrate-binding protein